jgi:hypothetical protein
MNHKTTTVLVAIAAVAATLLAAGTVAALGSDNFAFAHKRYSKTDSAFAYPRNGYMDTRDNGITKVPYKQIIICITTGQNSPIQTGACTNAMNVGKPGDLIGRAGTLVPRDISTTSQPGSAAPIMVSNTANQPAAAPKMVSTTSQPGSAAPIMVSNTANQPAAAAPMKVSSNNLGGSYPLAAAPMHSSTTSGQPQSSMNAKEFTPVKFPFDVNN